MIIATVWWLCFFTALGLCIGSFLNVVVYRLPLDQSLRSPVWSACPYCRRRIAWYDNLPILSFLLLRGRCRRCNAPIATRYVVVEALMAIIVLLLLDAFFIGQVRAGFSLGFGLTDRLAQDWPIFMAHIVLFACLLSMSIVDLEHYWVDVRFTHLAVLAGFIFHTIWTPRSDGWIRPGGGTAIVALFALAGLLITWLVYTCQPEAEPDDGEDVVPSSESSPQARARAPLAAPPRIAGWAAVLILLGLMVGAFLDDAGLASLRFAPRGVIPCVLLFVLIVSESTVSRQSDTAIVEVIEEEKDESRKMVLGELAMLLPAVCCGLVGYWLMRSLPSFAASVDHAMEARIRVTGFGLMTHWSPILGVSTAAAGYVISGALGWAIRIVFTLAFGKEAFGAGDIHLMAAAGCIAGWPVVVLGFFLTCGLALVGWVFTLPFKRTRALPLGPWLSLSFIIVVVFQDHILKFPPVSRTIEAVDVLFLSNSHVGLP